MDGAEASEKLTETAASPGKIPPHGRVISLSPRVQELGCREQGTAHSPGCSSLWQPSLNPLRWESLYKVPIPHFKPAFLLPATPSFHQHPTVLSFPFGLLARNKEQGTRNKSILAYNHRAEQLPSPAPAPCRQTFLGAVHGVYLVAEFLLEMHRFGDSYSHVGPDSIMKISSAGKKHHFVIPCDHVHKYNMDVPRLSCVCVSWGLNLREGAAWQSGSCLASRPLTSAFC